MDHRRILPEGFVLKSKNRSYIIEAYISEGANSIVYQAFYQDELMPEYTHTVLIKELYPFEPQGKIKRNTDWNLEIAPEADAFFQYHKKSFLLGNQAHLTLASVGSDRIAENLDSFEANGTFYTVLTAKKGQVLSERMERGERFDTLTDVILCIKNLLHALQPFHSHNMLHLDISPDNIFLLTPDEEDRCPTEVLLLDFNSVYVDGSVFASEEQYYMGKPEYMAPEVTLHRKEELGPWTDLYSVSAVMYEIITGEKLAEDRELEKEGELVSSYSRLLLHEKEVSAETLNEILRKGLQILPGKRYQSVSEMLEDIQKLLDIVNGRIRIAVTKETKEETGRDKKRGNRFIKSMGLVLLLLVGVAVGGFLKGRMEFWGQSMEQTKLDLTQIPLETDPSLILSEKNVRTPLPDHILKMQVRAETSVRLTLKDFTHPRDLSEVYPAYSIFSIYNGKGDKRGWQFADLTYGFFTTPDNAVHMELPFQDTNSFPLEYIGVIFANYNYDESNVLLDILNCTMIDGDGNEYAITDLVGSHALYFDEENWQWNLMTTQNQDFVESFEDIYGGKLVVDAQVNLLEPLLEIEWESDHPEIATVDEKGRIQGVRQGDAVITVTVRDKNTEMEKKTQMLVHVTSQLE